MGLAKIRKIVTIVEDTHEEAGQIISPPTRRAAAVAVIENPFAGTYQDDLETLMAIGEELGGLLGERCVAALGITPQQAQSYGKAALVGENGSWNMPRPFCIPALANRFVPLLKKAPPLSRQTRNGAVWDTLLMCRLVIKTLPMSDHISMGWKSASMTPHAPMKFWLPLRLLIQDVPCRVLAA